MLYLENIFLNIEKYGLSCRFYPGVPDALKFASSKVCIVTTKQVSFKQKDLHNEFDVMLKSPYYQIIVTNT